MQVVAEITPQDTKGNGGPAGRLLVVDQQLAFVGLARLVGGRMGYQTGAILDPRDLAARVQEWRPTVLVMEIVLPELDGIEMIGILSDLGFDGQLVLVTSHDQRYLELARKTAAARGIRVASCLAKPVRTAEMIRAIQHCGSGVAIGAAAQ
jgi:CheY-like chemotaxis protein